METAVQLLRYAIILGGGVAVGAGWASKEQVKGLLDALPEIVGAASVLGTIVWGVYVKWNTKSVPAPIAEKPSVPVVSTVTGKVVK